MENGLFILRKRVAQPARSFALVLSLLLITWVAYPVLASEPPLLPAGEAGVVQGPAVTEADPWVEADLIQPEELARVLANHDSEKPTLVYVGFPLLYKAGRIPGAVYFGPGRSAEGLASLKKWARGLQPNQPVVMYCGCCPWGECPNVRPAFKALREAGVKRLKLLYLPTSLLRDWVEKDYPFKKGS
ncbi:MAG TPA: rhodanese-like domain-containing protein [Terriglobia bacterium]|nr:rhodanese-like domain-containing protein [Terriglobia bacterium]